MVQIHDAKHLRLERVVALYRETVAKRVGEAFASAPTAREAIEAVRDGEFPDGLDLGTIASFYTTFAYGLALRARDGASREAMKASVDGAMAAWPALTSPAPAGKAR